MKWSVHNVLAYPRLTIFIVFLVSFTLYGIEGIAEEIGIHLYYYPLNSQDDPFGKDENGTIPIAID